MECSTKILDTPLDEWTSGQTPNLIWKGIGAQCNTENYVPIAVPRLSTGSSSLTASTSTAGASISATEPILRTCSGARVSSECKVDAKVVGDVHGLYDGVDCCGNSGDM